MATTVTDDANVITTRDTLVGFGIGNVGSPNSAIPAPRVEGTNANDARMNGTGLGGNGFNAGSTDVSTKHVFQWVYTLDDVETEANNGWSIRLASSTNGLTNFKSITVSGGDTNNLRRKGYSCFCCNGLRDGEASNGTEPDGSAVISFSVLADHLTNSTRFTWFIDETKRMTGITLTAGTAGVPGTSFDVAANDVTNGRGSWMTAEGVNYILGGVTIGDVTAATDSHFTDNLETWVFRDQPVKNDFHKIVTVGGTGTNAVTFGSEVGSGITAVGVGGNLFKSATTTSACFNVLNTDADINAHFFGCQFINSLYEDHCLIAWVHDASAGAAAGFTERTEWANIATLAASMFPATEANDDAWYIGDRDRGFFGCNVAFNVSGVGSPVLAFEYYNGTVWTDLDNLVDGTNGMTQDGVITFAKPDDWTSLAVGNTGSQETAFYIRFRIVSGTYSTNPTILLTRPLHAGLIKFEQANSKAVSCLFSGCGPITIRNSGIIRKCTITDSNAGVAGALDLGATAPAADTVRDLQIQNSPTGIRVAPGPTAKVTYGFTNIKFAGNTQDVLNDGVATDTDIYADTNQNATTALNNTVHGAAQSVTGDGGTLSRARFMLSKSASPTGTAVAKLYAHTGTFGTTSEPTGAAVATSETLDVSTLTGTLALTDFEFRDEFVLVNTTKYVIAIEYTAGSAVNTVNVGTDTSTPGHGGNFATANTGFTWTAVGGTDAIFTLRTGAIAILSVSGGGDTPTVLTRSGATIVQNNITVTFDTMKDNTEVRIYAAGTSTELAGIENATAGTADNRNFAASLAAGLSVDYTLVNNTHEIIRVEGFTWPSANVTLDQQQRVDRNYENPA